VSTARIPPRPPRRALLATGLGALGVVGTGQPVGGATLPQAGGIVATSSLIVTGFGVSYSPVQHVGARACHLTAALGADPYQPGGPVHR
jgi:hypothetical protein